MRIEFYSQKKLEKEIRRIIDKYLDLSQYKIFFFGSRVLGKGSERSDIDVGIEGPKEIPSSIFLDIQEEIENLPTLYKIDIVDFKRVSLAFKKIAFQSAEFIS